jgi:hypothetical protein
MGKKCYNNRRKEDHTTPTDHFKMVQKKGETNGVFCIFSRLCVDCDRIRYHEGGDDVEILILLMIYSVRLYLWAVTLPFRLILWIIGYGGAMTSGALMLMGKKPYKGRR